MVSEPTYVRVSVFALGHLLLDFKKRGKGCFRYGCPLLFAGADGNEDGEDRDEDCEGVAVTELESARDSSAQIMQSDVPDTVGRSDETISGTSNVTDASSDGFVFGLYCT